MPPSIQIKKVSAPFRVLYRLFLRKKRCPGCSGVLEIVYVYRLTKTGWGRAPGSHAGPLDIRMTYDNYDYFKINLAYQCKACGRVWDRAGRPIETPAQPRRPADQ